MRKRGVLRRRRIRRIRAAVLLVCILSLIVGLYMGCRPVLTAFAESKAIWTATEIANSTVAAVLNQYTELCRDMIQVTYTDTAHLSSVIPNTASVNTVRTAITDHVMAQMKQVTSLSVSIPAGTLLGPDWLSGWGPLLTFPISYTATVLSDVSSSLEAVGMNQSTYRVLMNLDIHLYVVTPGGRSTVGTQVSYPMAEAVLLGEVPDNLTEVYGDDQSILGKIFDYGTGE